MISYPEDDLKSQLTLNKKELELLEEKNKSLNILINSEKSMNEHLKSQIEILQVTIDEISKINDKYLLQIVNLKLKLVKEINSKI
jgi:hypothetical protein